MDPPNSDESGMREIALDDIQEGAWLWLLSTGICHYLNISAAGCKSELKVPNFLLINVSGEYAMHKAAFLLTLVKRRQVILESLLAFKRAEPERDF